MKINILTIIGIVLIIFSVLYTAYISPDLRISINEETFNILLPIFTLFLGFILLTINSFEVKNENKS